jgi:hypothetical protein
MKGLLIPPSTIHHIQASSLLPFLYSTKTLLSLSRPRRTPRTLCNHCISYRSLSFTSRRQAGEYDTRNPARNPFEDSVFANPSLSRSSDSDVPFDDVESQFGKAGNSKKSTMTPSEKAIFDRIFKDIDESSADIAKEEDASDEQDAESDPYEDLNSIFDKAIQDVRARDEQKAKSNARLQRRAPPTYTRAIDQSLILKESSSLSPRAFLRPLKLANGVVVGGEADMQENEEYLRKACDDHRGLVANLLEHAATDVQIWNLLEKEVFSLVQQLDAQMKVEEKARKTVEREEKKLAKQKSKEEATHTKKNVMTGDQGAPKESSSTNPESVALPTSTLISILQYNYADYLLSALRLLRRHHPTSFYALYLLPHMKRLGPISYVLGASTAFYNEILFLKWTQFSDLHGMADLMQEMINQGIETNEVTMVFIRRLNAKRRYGRMGRFGPVLQKWWDMRGNVEGWKRVWGMYEQIKREDRERVERDALVQSRAYEGEGEVEEDE